MFRLKVKCTELKKGRAVISSLRFVYTDTVHTLYSATVVTGSQQNDGSTFQHCTARKGAARCRAVPFGAVRRRSVPHIAAVHIENSLVKVFWICEPRTEMSRSARSLSSGQSCLSSVDSRRYSLIRYTRGNSRKCRQKTLYCTATETQQLAKLDDTRWRRV